MRLFAPTPSFYADEFLDLVHQSRRGRLKLYLGYAEGVGKTYQMLQEAQALRERGVDVVVGTVAHHGRPETRALLDGLEGIEPARRVHRGIEVCEMDVDAALARKPQVVIVDDVAHTNAPFCRNNKRYKDVQQLLAAGINVIGALDVQHLESLTDLVGRVTGMSEHDTVPDAFVQQADQLVSLDLAIEDLQERLRAGKVFAPERLAWARQHLYRDESLAALRELALRTVAEGLERKSRAQRLLPPGAAPHRFGRVLVCMSSYPPYALRLLYRGSTLAGRLNTDWFVAYVQTPEEAPERLDSKTQQHLVTNMDKARELGAEFVRLVSDNPVTALLEFAEAHGVAHIIVGRSHQAWWKQLLGRSVPLRLVRQCQGFDLHIVSLDLAHDVTEQPTRGLE